ncbi:MAG: aspartate ammonia-lyase [bacterium]
MKTKAAYRTEHDALGSRQIPRQALYGIHTQRAVENFPLAQRPAHPRLIRSYGFVKLACVRANRDLGCWNEKKFRAIASACHEMADSKLDEHILTDALQGGAGTSLNMNVNEVIANRALQLLGKKTGDYAVVHPLDDVNKHQSTNDTYPTALKVAAIFSLRDLETAVVSLQEAFQEKEKKFAGIVKVARTQLQDAVLTTLGREMSAYAEALSRDRWRIDQCQERLRVVNLGGTAIGTGLGAPRPYIFGVVERLREVTGLGLARAENMVDATQNADVFVEVSGILRTLASTLLKISTDLRLLSSGPEAGINEISLPPLQAGSSIMPGKVNPVIPEAVSQAAIAVFAHDHALATACSLGNLELNQFMPLIADALLHSLDLLRNACGIFANKCVIGLKANADQCRRHVHGATATLTALVSALGYKKAERLAKEARKNGNSVRQQAVQSGWLTEKEFDRLVSPDAVTKLGSS